MVDNFNPHSVLGVYRGFPVSYVFTPPSQSASPPVRQSASYCLSGSHPPNWSASVLYIVMLTTLTGIVIVKQTLPTAWKRWKWSWVVHHILHYAQYCNDTSTMRVASQSVCSWIPESESLYLFPKGNSKCYSHCARACVCMHVWVCVCVGGILGTPLSTMVYLALSSCWSWSALAALISHQQLHDPWGTFKAIVVPCKPLLPQYWSSLGIKICPPFYFPSVLSQT